MGRLEHLKLSLPAMMAQGAKQVIVVDFSCPEGTGAHVAREFPKAEVISVEGQQSFAPWRARNAGAACANAEMLLFCDADLILAKGALAAIDRTLPDNAFGLLQPPPESDPRAAAGLGSNQLRGLQVVPAAAFDRNSGYDDLLEGYASGGDTDLQTRLTLDGLLRFPLGIDIVERVLPHTDQARLANHRMALPVSYAAGVMYRTAKYLAMKILEMPNLPLEMRSAMYRGALVQARSLARERSSKVTLNFDDEDVPMGFLFGTEGAAKRVSVTVEIEKYGPARARRRRTPNEFAQKRPKNRS